MNTRTFTPTEGVNLEQSLPFTAITVVVDNITPSWLLIPGAHRPVPPFQYGVTMPIQPGVQVAQALWVTPSKVIAPTPSNAQAYVQFLDVPMTPSNGTPIVNPTQQVNLLGPINWTGTGGADTIASQVAVPPGANALMVVFNESDVQNIVSLAVVDHVGNYQYIDMATPRIANPAVGIFSPAAGGTVDFLIQTNGVQTVRGLRLIAAFGTTGVAIQPSGFNLDVVGTSTSNGAVRVFFDSGDATGNAVTDTYTADATITTASTLVVGATPTLAGVFFNNLGPNALRFSFSGAVTPTATLGIRVAPGQALIRTRPDLEPDAIHVVAEAGTSVLNLMLWVSR